MSKTGDRMPTCSRGMSSSIIEEGSGENLEN